MFKKSFVAAVIVATLSGCSSISVNGNEREKERMCTNIGDLYYQIAQAKSKDMSSIQLWHAIELGIMDTDNLSDSDVQMLRQWGKSAINNVYKSPESYPAKSWKKMAYDQCTNNVNVY